jgi:hypothetical protein
MCFRKPMPVAITATNVYLGFGINDYLGTANDLRGCVNDINNEAKKYRTDYPTAQILKYFDAQVTTQFFVSEVKRVMNELSAHCYQVGVRGHLSGKYSGHGTQIPSSSEPNGYNEALYLRNGPLIDNIIYQLQQETPGNIDVVFKFDSCFSGDIGSRNLATAINSINYGYRKSRFMPIAGVPILHNPVKRLAETDEGQKWIIFSGCMEEETSVDAYIDGQYQGAFTWADLKSYGPGSGYERELSLVKDRLFINHFKQNPELSGPHEGKVMPF